MRALCGLFALLILLGPIGMGIMLNVDSPYLEDDALSITNENTLREDYGTRATPDGIPKLINLYFKSNEKMNTTAPPYINPSIAGFSLTFSLEDPLINELKIEGSMTVVAYLSGAGTVEITVSDSGGPVLGSATYGPFSLGNIPQPQTIIIPLITGSSYNISAGNKVVVDVDFGVTAGRLHFNSNQAQSRLEILCTPVLDITVETFNFYSDSEPTKTFYPRDIDFPESRRKVRIKGIVTEAFGKLQNIKYISNVDVMIEGPNTNITRACSYNKDDFEYSYTWNYPDGQDDGEYTITTQVYDEQGNLFTIKGNFTMSDYGVLLTSPSQFPEEGTFRAEARRNIVENSITTYQVNVRNIGNRETTVDIGTIGQWDFWISGDNLSVNNNKTGKIDAIPIGGSLGFHFNVDSLGNPVGSPPATNIITVSSSEKTTESSALTTISTVVYEYDVKLEFSDGSKEVEELVETGDSIDYRFTVTNEGGRDDTIYLDLSSVPGGWTTTLTGTKLKGSQGQYRVELESGKSADVTLTIDTPVGGEEEIVTIDISGRSKGSDDQGDDPVASDKITTITTTTKGIELIVDDPVKKSVDPEEDEAFKFVLTNTGTSLANITATFSGPGSSNGWDLQDVSFNPSGFETDKQFSNLAPNNPQSFFIYIEPSNEVLAGNYSITVTVTNDDESTRSESQTVYIIINEFYAIEIVEPLGLELFGEAEPGEDVTYSVTIENNGNTIERVNILVDKPREWGLDFGNASDEWTSAIEPGDSESITVVLTVPDDAPGDETIDITISIVPVQSDQIDVETHTTIKQIWYQPILTLLVPLLLLVVIIVMVVVIYKRR